ncbi:MAG: TonB-dependent receptor plug domain-containing protein [Bacteroidales bacterium]|nr:TonB-dependent receptor plug domain-containing protein [Bacteroidales bacterium]
MKRIFIIMFAALMLGGSVYAQEKVQTGKTTYKSVFDLLRDEPGVTIKGGAEGTMPRVYIRGVGTNSNETQPLFVVDGIYQDDVTYLRPEDIYSVEVIKDGTASMYGMQGQNGVIIFRTKSAVEAEKLAAETAKAARKAARSNKRNK